MSIYFDFYYGIELYKKYPGQTRPQDAYVYMDKNGVITAGYSPNIGGGMSSDEWHGLKLRWPVPPETDPELLANFLQNEMAPILEMIHNGHTVELDGPNFVGRLDEAAQEASEKLQEALNDYCQYHKIQYWDIEDYLMGADIFNELYSSKDLESLYDRVGLRAERDDIVFGNDYIEGLKYLKSSALKGLKKLLDEDALDLNDLEKAVDVAIKIREYDGDKNGIKMVLDRLENQVDGADERRQALIERLKAALNKAWKVVKHGF